MSSSPRILVMAGGTGGHVFPALAVAKSLANEGWQVRWLGTPERMEARLVPQHGFDISFIDIKGVRGNGFWRKLAAPMAIVRATVQAWQVIQSFKPDVILGMGGFASGPGGLAAKLAGIPLVIHEQNAMPGMTNKLLAKVADQVLCAFPNTGLATGKHCQVVGNPVRQELVRLGQQAAAQKPHDSVSALNVLVVGGSLGAKVLNDVMPEVAAALVNQQSLTLWHQVGKGNLTETEQAYQQRGLTERVKVTEFIDDMEAAYRWADIVVCRSGALTVSELATVGLASILVPYPHAVDDHQTLNAQVLVDAKAAWLLPQAQLNAEQLIEKLKMLATDPQLLQQMSQQARQVACDEATALVADCCRRLAKVPEKG